MRNREEGSSSRQAQHDRRRSGSQGLRVPPDVLRKSAPATSASRRCASIRGSDIRSAVCPSNAVFDGEDEKLGDHNGHVSEHWNCVESRDGSARCGARARVWKWCRRGIGRSEEHTSELQSLMRISYAVFCLKKKKQIIEQFVLMWPTNQ